MSIKIKSAVYQTTDNQEFQEEIVAKEHQELIDAAANLNAAKSRYELALASTWKTKDGKPFSFRLNYYVVVDRYDRRPYCKTINVAYDARLNDYSQPVILVYDANTKQYDEYRIDNLYADSDAAEVAVTKSLQGWVSDMQKEIQRRTCL